MRSVAALFQLPNMRLRSEIFRSHMLLQPLKCMLQGIWAALSGHAWQPAAVPLILALAARIRQRTLGAIYSFGQPVCAKTLCISA